jgi:hypothetical protein
MLKPMEELLLLNSNLMTKGDQISRKLPNKCLKNEFYKYDIIKLWNYIKFFNGFFIFINPLYINQNNITF